MSTAINRYLLHKSDKVLANIKKIHATNELINELADLLKSNDTKSIKKINQMLGGGADDKKKVDVNVSELEKLKQELAETEKKISQLKSEIDNKIAQIKYTYKSKALKSLQADILLGKKLNKVEQEKSKDQSPNPVQIKEITVPDEIQTKTLDKQLQPKITLSPSKNRNGTAFQKKKLIIYNYNIIISNIIL